MAKLTKYQWFSEYKEIATKHFKDCPDSVFDLGDWTAHEQDYMDGFTPDAAFHQDLYTDI